MIRKHGLLGFLGFLGRLSQKRLVQRLELRFQFGDQQNSGGRADGIDSVGAATWYTAGGYVRKMIKVLKWCDRIHGRLTGQNEGYLGFGGRGGMRDGPGGQGGRGDFFSGRGNRGRGLGGPRGGQVGWGRGERGPHDRYNMDGRGRGRGRGRFDNRRDVAHRSRGRSYSRSPERVRTWDYSRSRSRSRSRSWSRGRSRSRSWSRGRSRSYSRSISRSCSRSHGHSSRSYSRSRSRSPSYDRRNRSHQQKSDQNDFQQQLVASEPRMSPVSPSNKGNSLGDNERLEQLQAVESDEPVNPAAVVDPCHQSDPNV